MVLQGKENNRSLMQRTCQNCDFEEYCNHVDTGICNRWRPDLDYTKLMEASNKNKN